MYADSPTVIALAKNKRSTTNADDVAAAASICDPEIDGTLSTYFFWPNDANGHPVNSPPPQLVVTISSLLAAALIESEAYAMNEAGQNVANPYAAALEARARTILSGLVRGTIVVTQLSRLTQLQSQQAPKGFKPVTELASSGSRRAIGPSGDAWP